MLNPQRDVTDMKKKPPIYLLSPKLNYKTFYSIWRKFPAGDIVPTWMIKGVFVHKMIKRKEMYLYIDPLEKGDEMIFAVKLPKGRRILVIENAK